MTKYFCTISYQWLYGLQVYYNIFVVIIETMHIIIKSILYQYDLIMKMHIANLIV